MAVIDLTLNNLKFANVLDFNRGFGSKKTAEQNGGSMSTMEINGNFAAPFDVQRPVEVLESSSTTEIQRNVNLIVSADNVSLTLGESDHVKCNIFILNNSATAVTITSPNGSTTETYTVTAGSFLSLWWNGTRWWNTDVPIDFIYTQYPFEKNPLEIFGTGEWEDISNTYEGAYLRALGEESAEWEALQAEGIPNIEGSVFGSYAGFGVGTGAFSKADTPTSFGFDSGTVEVLAVREVFFDASDSNPIYGANEHVTPKSYAIKIWKKTAH